jgi:hypothetical protein
MGLSETHQVLTSTGCATACAAHRRRHQDRPRRGDRRHAGRRGVRHRHGVADRHGLHHGAAVPLQHLPGRRLHPGPVAREIRGHAGEGRQPVQLRRRGGARDPGAARLQVAGRDRRPHRPAEAGGPRRAPSRRPRPQPAADAGRRRPRGRCTARSKAATRCPTRSMRRCCATPQPLFSTARRCSCSTTSGTPTAPSARGCRP